MEMEDVIEAAKTIKEWCEKHHNDCATDCKFDEGVSCMFLHGLPNKWEIKQGE